MEMHGAHRLDTLFMMHTHVIPVTLTLDPHAQFTPSPPMHAHALYLPPLLFNLCVF